MRKKTSRCLLSDTIALVIIIGMVFSLVATCSMEARAQSKPLDLLSVPQSLVDTERNKRLAPQQRLDRLRRSPEYQKAYNQQAQQFLAQQEKLIDLYMDKCFFLSETTPQCEKLRKFIENP